MQKALKSAVVAMAIGFITACQTDVTAPSVTALPGGASQAIVDNGDGTWFVGKGDVQTFFGWNNPRMQANAAYIEFRIASSTTTTWTCTKLQVLGNGNTNEIVQNRQNSSSTQGVFTTQGRTNSQGPVTGFNLTLNGAATVQNDGPAIGSCPANPSGFVYDNNAVTVTSGGGLQIMVGSGAPGPFLTPTGKNAGVWYNFPG